MKKTDFRVRPRKTELGACRELIRVYRHALKLRSIDRIYMSRVSSGVCWLVQDSGIIYGGSSYYLVVRRGFRIRKPPGAYWFSTPGSIIDFPLKGDNRARLLARVKRLALKPRLDLLLKIEKQILNEIKKSK